MMKTYNLYSKEKLDPEANMYLICSCKTKEGAEYVKNALLYRDTHGRMDDTGMYDYYINLETV